MIGQIEEVLDWMLEQELVVVPGSGEWIQVNGSPVYGIDVAKAEVTFRGANEAAWARVLDALGVAWKYEALEPGPARALRYLPDFWLGERGAWLEIKKNPPTPGEIRVARELLAADGHAVYIVAGWPGRGRYQVSVFAPNGEARTQRPDWCDLALCQLFDCGFTELWAAFKVARRG